MRKTIIPWHDGLLSGNLYMRSDVRAVLVSYLPQFLTLQNPLLFFRPQQNPGELGFFKRIQIEASACLTDS